jgi:integrase
MTERRTTKRMTAADFEHGNLSANTRRAYAADIKHFRKHGGKIPTNADAIIAYLADQSGWLSVATLNRRLMAIRQAHTAMNLPSPLDDPRINSVLRGIKREYGTAQHQAKPVLRRHLRKMLKPMGKSPLDLRDKALLLLGFAGGFRRSELMALNIDDIERVKEGFYIRLRGSKTDQEKKGRTVAIPQLTSSLCAVAAVERWLRYSHIDDGPIFQSVSRSGKPTGIRLADGYVSVILKQRLTAAGIDASDYSAHSLRAGLVTEATKAGISTAKIMAQTGHKSFAMLSRYIRDADLFAGNAARAVM